MSLGIAFKGPEGIVLAVDSRVTLMTQLTPSLLLPATYDNATKLLQVQGQPYVGAITYGLGAIGLRKHRTAHSYLPEFESEINGDKSGEEKLPRLSVEDFANKLSSFYMQQWLKSDMPPDYAAQPMVFIVAGYDEHEAYGKVYVVEIPNNPTPVEQMRDDFGATWGGQREIVDRIINGFDVRMLEYGVNGLGLKPEEVPAFEQKLKRALAVRIPFQFLPLQDCVDLSIFLIRSTITMQNWLLDVRGVGGAIDVATITKTDGFSYVQHKEVRGERHE